MLRNDSSCFFFDFVESVHRGNDAFVNRAFHCVSGAADCRSCEPFFFLEKIAEDVIGSSFSRRRTDSNAQSWNLFAAELHDDRFQSVVAARTTTLPNPQSTKGQRKIIQHDEDFLGRNLKELGNREKRMAAPVHVTRRLN